MSLPTNFFIGRGGKLLEAPDFSSATGVVHAASNTEILRLPVSSTATFNGGNATVTNSNFQMRGNFPANLLDVAWGLEDPSTIRIIGVTSNPSTSVCTIPTDFSASTSVVATQDSTYLNNIRAICMLRNGIFVTGESNNSRLVTWKLNSDGTLTRLNDLQDSSHLDNIQCIINPNDGATLGESTMIFVATSSGQDFRAYEVSATGGITFKQQQNLSSNGTQIILSPMASGNANKVRMMAFPKTNSITVYDYNLTTHQFTTISQGSTWSSSYGDPSAATPGWGGYTYVASKNPNQTALWLKLYQNGVIQNSVQNNSLNGSYLNGMLAVDDGTSSSNIKGNIYWSCYNGGSSPERRVMRTEDRSATNFSNTIQTAEIFANGSYGVGGNIIGTRPKYAEFDAKLASTHW